MWRDCVYLPASNARNLLFDWLCFAFSIFRGRLTGHYHIPYCLFVNLVSFFDNFKLICNFTIICKQSNKALTGISTQFYCDEIDMNSKSMFDLVLFALLKVIFVVFFSVINACHNHVNYSTVKLYVLIYIHKKQPVINTRIRTRRPVVRGIVNKFPDCVCKLIKTGQKLMNFVYTENIKIQR